MSSPYYIRLPLSEDPLHPSIDKASMERAQIGRDYWHASVDQIPDGLAYKSTLIRYCKRIASCERRGIGLYIHGPLGVGKTAAAAIVLKAAIIRGGTALFMTAAEIQRAFSAKNTPRLMNGAPVEDGCNNVQFLVIDDLGAEDQSTEWKQHFVELVIRARQRDRLPTIITSNVSPANIKHDWLRSILNRHYAPILVDGHNWRA